MTSVQAAPETILLEPGRNPIPIFWQMTMRVQQWVEELEAEPHRPDPVSVARRRNTLSRLRREVAKIREGQNPSDISGALLTRIDECLERVEALNRKPPAPVRIIGGYPKSCRIP